MIILNKKQIPDLPADKIEYHNPSYPTVEAALDKLLYVNPSVSLSGGNMEKEKGSSVSSTITLSWSWNKNPVSQKLTIGSTSITLEPNVRKYYYTPENPITSNLTFTISGSDGTKNASNSNYIVFYDRYYYGSSSKASLSNAEIIALNPSYIKIEKNTIIKTYGPYTGYIYLVFPVSECAGIKFFTGAGFQTNDYLLTTQDVTNSSGRTISYNIYRFKSDRAYETPESIRSSYTN